MASIEGKFIIDLKAAVASGKLSKEEVEHCNQMLLHNAAWIIANFQDRPGDSRHNANRRAQNGN